MVDDFSTDQIEVLSKVVYLLSVGLPHRIKISGIMIGVESVLGHATTRLTMRPGTTMTRRTVLPSSQD